MPSIDTNMVFAFLNAQDRHHDVASRLFSLITKGYNVELPASVLIEMELIYKSNKRDDDLVTHIANLISVPNVNSLTLAPKTILLAIKLREDYDLSFFDSHHVAVALEHDGKLISTVQKLDRVPELELIDPVVLTKDLNI